MQHIGTRSVKVECFRGKSGQPIHNQYKIYTDTGVYFQSYQSIIAFKPYNGQKTMLNADAWDYSCTTGKYRNEFLNEGIDETREKIKTGKYLLFHKNDKLTQSGRTVAWSHTLKKYVSIPDSW